MMEPRFGARHARCGPARTLALIGAIALAGCASPPPPPPAPPRGDPPENRPAFVEEFRRAAEAMDPDLLARFIAFQDPLEEEFFRLQFPKKPAEADRPRVEILYARAIPPDWYFLCLRASEAAPVGGGEEAAGIQGRETELTCTFRREGERWVTRDLPSLRDLTAPEDLVDYMRWKTVERLAEVRFGPSDPSVWIDEIRARLEGVEVLSAEPYSLVDPGRVEASRESLARLMRLPEKTPDALARAMAENLPPSFFTLRGYTLAFFLEARDGEPGIRIRPREGKESMIIESLPVLHDGAVIGANLAPVEGEDGPARVTFALTPAGAEILRGIAGRRGGEPIVVVAGGEAIAAARIPAPEDPPALCVGPVPEESAQLLARAGNAYAKAARALIEKLRAETEAP